LTGGCHDDRAIWSHATLDIVYNARAYLSPHTIQIRPGSQYALDHNLIGYRVSSRKSAGEITGGIHARCIRPSPHAGQRPRTLLDA
jgi:hypothetical protein